MKPHSASQVSMVVSWRAAQVGFAGSGSLSGSCGAGDNRDGWLCVGSCPWVPWASRRWRCVTRDQTMTLAGVDLESGVAEGRVTIATTVSSSLGIEAEWGMGNEAA